MKLGPTIRSQLHLILPILSLLLNVQHIAQDLPTVTHPDEPRVILHAIAIAAGDPNPHFFFYPTLWLYIVAFAQMAVAACGLMIGAFRSKADLAALVFTNPTVFYLTGRILCAALGAAAVWLMWRIGNRFSSFTGWVGALSLLLFGPLVWQAHYATPDVPLLFFFLVCLDACFSRLTSLITGRRWLAFPAIAAGLATSVKYNAFVSFGAVAALIALRVRSTGAGGLAFMRSILVGSGISTLTFLLTSPFIVIDLPSFRRDFGTVLSGIPLAEGVAPGLLGYPLLLLQNTGPIFLLAALAGWAVLFISPEPGSHRKHGLILAAAFVPYFVMVEFSSYRTPRTILPVIPAICLGAGIAMSRLNSLTAHLPIRAIYRALFLLAILSLMLSPMVRSIAHVERDLGVASASTMAQKWIQEHLPPGTRLLVESGTRIALPPDRETVLARMQLWAADSVSTSKQLRTAYSYYLRTDVPQRGYRLAATHNYRLNTFTSGADSLQDYDSALLDSVEYVVAPSWAFAFGKHPARDQFYKVVRSRFGIVHEAVDARGVKLIVLRWRPIDGS